MDKFITRCTEIFYGGLKEEEEIVKNIHIKFEGITLHDMKKQLG